MHAWSRLRRWCCHARVHLQSQHLKDAAPRVALRRRFPAIFSTLDGALFRPARGGRSYRVSVRSSAATAARLNLNDHQLSTLYVPFLRPFSWTVARLKNRPAFNIICAACHCLFLRRTPWGFHDYLRSPAKAIMGCGLRAAGKPHCRAGAVVTWVRERLLAGAGGGDARRPVPTAQWGIWTRRGVQQP